MRKTWAQSVHRFDHWGAAECGLQLGVTQTRLDRLPESGGANGRADLYHLRSIYSGFRACP